MGPWGGVEYLPHVWVGWGQVEDLPHVSGGVGWDRRFGRTCGVIVGRDFFSKCEIVSHYVN